MADIKDTALPPEDADTARPPGDGGAGTRARPEEGVEASPASAEPGSAEAAPESAEAAPESAEAAPESAEAAPESAEPPAETAPAGPQGPLAAPFLQIHLPVFEGPLDLLLHLVREHRLDVFDIPIAFITQKYLETIGRMRELNLDVAGEFLVMAATLAHIKSRMLLPKPEPEDEDSDEPQGDPREELVRRLLEYQKYREVAEQLGRQDILDRDVFTRRAQPGPMAIPEGELDIQEVSVFKLIEALDQVLARAKVDNSHQVILERVSISDRINQLVEMLRERKTVSFFDIFEGARVRSQIIVTFLALLEMARLGLARIHQDTPEGEIQVSGRDRVGEDELADVVDDFR